MKKIVFDKPSEIYYLDVDINMIVYVTKKDKAFGTIVFDGMDYVCVSANIKSMKCKALSDAKSWFGADCKFYVLD